MRRGIYEKEIKSRPCVKQTARASVPPEYTIKLITFNHLLK